MGKLGAPGRIVIIALMQPTPTQIREAPLCGTTAIWSVRESEDGAIIYPQALVPYGPLVMAMFFACGAGVMLVWKGQTLTTTGKLSSALIVFLLLCIGAVTCVGVWSVRKLHQAEAVRSGSGIEINIKHAFVRNLSGGPKIEIRCPTELGLGEKKTYKDQVRGEGRDDWTFSLHIRRRDGTWLNLLEEPWPGFGVKRVSGELCRILRLASPVRVS